MLSIRTHRAAWTLARIAFDSDNRNTHRYLPRHSTAFVPRMRSNAR